MSGWRDTPAEQGDDAPPVAALEPQMPSLRETLIAQGIITPAEPHPLSGRQRYAGALPVDGAGRSEAEREMREGRPRTRRGGVKHRRRREVSS